MRFCCRSTKLSRTKPVLVWFGLFGLVQFASLQLISCLMVDIPAHLYDTRIFFLFLELFRARHTWHTWLAWRMALGLGTVHLSLGLGLGLAWVW